MAIKYLKSTLDYNDWTRTSDTEPGHDGCLCIYFDGFVTEWWMEAKYSLSPNNLTRGRLDSTIIEVLLNKSKNIERLFIVTNCDISSKIKKDIRTVVVNNSQCHSVEFITRDLLELWLIENYDMYEQYFENPIPKSEMVLSTDLFITKDLEIYDMISAQSLQKSPSNILYVGKRYNLYFNVYSQKPRIIKLKSKIFKFNKKNNSINLESGINECMVSSILSYGDTIHNKALSIILCDETTKSKVVCETTYNIDIIDNNSNIILTSSQKKCLYSLKHSINDNLKHFQLFSIYGKSGMGKTFISDYMPNIIPDNSIIEHESFTEDPYVNAKYILKTLLYIYFPYAYGNTLSESIKAIILDNFNSGVFLYKLANIDTRDNQEQLLALFRETCDMYLFPKTNNLYKKYIIWDNISKLDNALLRFIVLFIKQLKLYDENIYFVIIQNDKINDLISISEHSYDITLSDIDIKNLLDIEIENSRNVAEYFPDLLTVLDLKNFLRNYNLKINNIEEFKLVYLTFLHGEYEFNFVDRKFIDLSDKETLVLNRIYYSYSGISTDDFSSKLCVDEINSIIFKLISKNLIKYNSDHKLIPYHDIYLNRYKKRFRFDIGSLEIVEAQNPEEILKNQLLSLTDSDINSYCCCIKNRLENYDFSSVYFILEELPVYSSEIKKQIGIDKYLQLAYYRIYADANVKMSGISAYKQFSYLWDELENETISTSNYSLKLHTLYELSNAAYDNFDYQKCFTYQESAATIEKKLHKLGYNRYNDKDIEYCYNEIDYMVVLSKSELGEKISYKYTDNCEGVYRFLRSKCILSKGILEFIHYAKNTLTEECFNNNIKHYIKADFDVAFLEVIIDINTSLWYKRLIEKRDKFNGINKNYYIKATYSIISVLLVFQMFDEAVHMSEISFYGNDTNPRMQLFHLEICAAIKAYQCEYESAISLLKKQYDLCKNVKSYSCVIEHNISILKRERKKLCK